MTSSKPLSSQSPPPTHVVFDLDGTLLDTEGLYSEVTQSIADRYGKQYTIEVKRRCVGGDARRSAAITIEALGLPMSVDAFLTEREALLLEGLAGAAEIEGATALVAALAEAGVPIALATSSYRSLCDAKLRGREFARAFDAIVCGDDPRLTRPKPEPDIFLLAARDLGAEASRCLAFEDSANGVRAALAAGMRVVAVADPRWGFDPAAFPDLHLTVSDLAGLSPGRLGL